MVECEKLQSILCCWQYKVTNIKLKSLGMVTLRAKEFSAGFHCALKENTQKFKWNTHTPLHRFCTYLNFVIPTHFWTDFIRFNLNTAKKMINVKILYHRLQEKTEGIDGKCRKRMDFSSPKTKTKRG